MVDPPAKSPEMRECSKKGEETRVSCPIRILPELVYVANARPMFTASVGVKSTLTTPRIPEVPKSFCSTILARLSKSSLIIYSFSMNHFSSDNS